jgi:hypothetical protein
MDSCARDEACSAVGLVSARDCPQAARPTRSTIATDRIMAARRRYFFGALDGAALAAVAAFFLESFAACLFSAEILRGLESSVAELSIGLP